MTTHVHLVACARALLGVRFAHQGRHPAQGLDCLGLLLVAAEQAGVTIAGQSPRVFDDQQYGTRPDALRLEAMLGKHLQRIAPEQIAPGDVLLLTVDGRAQHLALVSEYAGDGELGMIHAYAVTRNVVEHRLDTSWRQQIAAAFRLP